MTVRIGLNGCGRVGQNLLWLLATMDDAEVRVVAINDVVSPQRLLEALQFDSMRGGFPVPVELHGDFLVMGERRVRLFSQSDPRLIPWDEVGVQVVIEATGAFRDGRVAAGHIGGGVRSVIISASAENVDAVIMPGINEHVYDPHRHRVVSMGSCGVNGLAAMTSVLSRQFGLSGVSTHCELPIQPYQFTHDRMIGASRDDARLGRAASKSVVPHTHVDGTLLHVAVPEIGPLLSYVFVTAPMDICGSVTLRGTLRGAVSAEAIHEEMRQAADGRLRGILQYGPEGRVSIDAARVPASCMFDPALTWATPDGDNTHVCVTGWFNGELANARGSLNLAALVGRSLQPA